MLLVLLTTLHDYYWDQLDGEVCVCVQKPFERFKEIKVDTKQVKKLIDRNTDVEKKYGQLNKSGRHYVGAQSEELSFLFADIFLTRAKLCLLPAQRASFHRCRRGPWWSPHRAASTIQTFSS